MKVCVIELVTFAIISNISKGGSSEIYDDESEENIPYDLRSDIYPYDGNKASTPYRSSFVPGLYAANGLTNANSGTNFKNTPRYYSYPWPGIQNNNKQDPNINARKRPGYYGLNSDFGKYVTSGHVSANKGLNFIFGGKTAFGYGSNGVIKIVRPFGDIPTASSPLSIHDNAAYNNLPSYGSKALPYFQPRPAIAAPLYGDSEIYGTNRKVNPIRGSHINFGNKPSSYPYGGLSITDALGDISAATIPLAAYGSDGSPFSRFSGPSFTSKAVVNPHASITSPVYGGSPFYGDSEIYATNGQRNPIRGSNNNFENKLGSYPYGSSQGFSITDALGDISVVTVPLAPYGSNRGAFGPLSSSSFVPKANPAVSLTAPIYGNSNIYSANRPVDPVRGSNINFENKFGSYPYSSSNGYNIANAFGDMSAAILPLSAYGSDRRTHEPASPLRSTASPKEDEFDTGNRRQNINIGNKLGNFPYDGITGSKIPIAFDPLPGHEDWTVNKPRPTLPLLYGNSIQGHTNRVPNYGNNPIYYGNGNSETFGANGQSNLNKELTASNKFTPNYNTNAVPEMYEVNHRTNEDGILGTNFERGYYGNWCLKKHSANDQVNVNRGIGMNYISEAINKPSYYPNKWSQIYAAQPRQYISSKHSPGYNAKYYNPNTAVHSAGRSTYLDLSKTSQNYDGNESGYFNSKSNQERIVINYGAYPYGPYFIDVFRAPQLYAKYLQDNRKTYATTYELLLRYEIFKQGLQAINYFRGIEPSIRYGINYQTDWMDDDFLKNFKSDYLIRHKDIRHRAIGIE